MIQRILENYFYFLTPDKYVWSHTTLNMSIDLAVKAITFVLNVILNQPIKNQALTCSFVI